MSTNEVIQCFLMRRWGATGAEGGEKQTAQQFGRLLDRRVRAHCHRRAVKVVGVAR